MNIFPVHRKSLATFLALTILTLVAGLSFSTMHQTNAQAASTIIKQVSSDPYTNDTSQHQTQVEPDTLSFGRIVVSAFQSGRFFAGGGSSNIGWATSLNAGKTWKRGFLPGITVYAGGTYARESDPVVAYVVIWVKVRTNQRQGSKNELKVGTDPRSSLLMSLCHEYTVL